MGRGKVTTRLWSRHPAIALIAGWSVPFVMTLPANANAAIPLSLLQTDGTGAATIAPLTWGLVALGIIVVTIISVFVLVGVIRRRQALPTGHGQKIPVEANRRGLSWIVVGVGTSSIALLAFVVWTVVTLAAINDPPSDPAFTIDVTAHQWWWEVAYEGADPSQTFETANEIHIPVGEPVRIRLHSADVIHSFWVPALGGKTDVIPGQVNMTWLQADRAGTYRGQCSEYCGVQHAHMGFLVIADTPDDFDAWRNAQLQPTSLENNEAVAAEPLFVTRCGACHTVRGTLAGGHVGPDLTHLMSRETIAAVLTDNNGGNLTAWISDPQAMKPGTKMPDVGLDSNEINAIRQFLLDLK